MSYSISEFKTNRNCNEVYSGMSEFDAVVAEFQVEHQEVSA